MPRNRAVGRDRARIPGERGDMLEDRSDNMGRHNRVVAEDKDDDEEALRSRLFHDKKVEQKKTPYEEAGRPFDPRASHVAWLHHPFSASKQVQGWQKELLFSSFSNCLSPTKYSPQSLLHARPSPLSRPDLSWPQPSHHPLHTTYHLTRLFSKIFHLCCAR
jgi:hypothetical protein